MATFTKRQRKSGTRYGAQVYLGTDPTSGLPKNTAKWFRTKDEAEQWARKVEVKRDDGSYRPTTTTATLADYLRNTWLPSYRRRKPRSAYNTERTLTKWILNPQPDTPFIGRVKLRELTGEHFDRLYIAMAEKHGIQPRGIHHLHSLVRRALKAAVKKRKVAFNPTDEVEEAPKATLGPARYLTHEQEARVLDAARRLRDTATEDERDCFCGLWHLFLDTGVRPGEAFALKWERDTRDPDKPEWGWIDLDKKLVHVSASLTRVGIDKDKEGWKLTPPKTDNSRRVIPICEDTVAELERWRTEQKKQRLRAGPKWQAHGFVFTTEEGTPLGNNVRRAWASLMKQADRGQGDLGTWGPEPKKPRSGPTPEQLFAPRYSIYVLRHTHASLNYLDGMDLGLLSRRMGHHSYGFTFDRYGRGVKAEHTRAVADNTQRRWRAAISSS